MRIRLRGINRIRKRLADGSSVTYYYAWKGGPRLRGQPGTPEFIASYNEAAATKKAPAHGLLQRILNEYQASTDFTDLAERTRDDYIGKIKLIEKKFGDLPLAALPDKRTRGIFKDWRDELAKSSRRQADYAWTVLARVLSWALDRGKIDGNPCEKGGRLYHGSRAEKVWTLDDETAFLKVAPTHLRLPLMLAVWTGQREGDLLRLAWSAYDGKHIRLRQSKGGRRVTIPVGAPLKAALDATKKVSPLILTNSRGAPWTEDGFRSSWGKVRLKTDIVDRTFHDLRGTAVTRLAMVGCTVPEIATITGHSLGDVQAILDAHYFHRDPALAESAIRKLEAGTKSPN